ncbi:MAG: ATP-binding protein [Pyrobaculum sp.]
MKRVKVRFAGREVEFVDREVAIRQFEEMAEKGTRFPLVVYGPEGCGKSALLRQGVEVLKERGYSVTYVSPLAREREERLLYTEDLKDAVKAVLKGVAKRLPDPLGNADVLIDVAVEALYRVVKRGRNKKIAVLADDVFQAIGLDKAELLVKQFLNMIEWPSIKYEKIVIVVASSEGVTRWRIGRHSWAEIRAVWNMPREGFRQLYEQLSGDKPPFEEVWKWTGGNPRYLDELYKAGWDAGRLAARLAMDKRLGKFVGRLSDEEKELLKTALENPDVFFEEIKKAGRLADALVELNVLAEVAEYREPWAWVDQPPPERDPELGIGKYYAWQTPLHREAVRRALAGSGTYMPEQF